MHRTTIAADVGIIAAIVAFGPFFATVDASTTQAVAHDAPGIHLEGQIDDAAFGDPAEVSCGTSSFPGASDAITDGAGMRGDVEMGDDTYRAAFTEIQVVRQNELVVCIDAEGTLHDGDGEAVVGTWRLRPGATGTGVLTITPA
ncbi:MAG: hypothetical protein DHS20C19_24210 [Acidimicrobiales bacterium]|nr:MAG: hypothetical protein DHS20C19_24210 [Acidimicrobiales bacterium]